MKILIVDDEMTIADGIYYSLTEHFSEEYIFVRCYSPIQAMQLIAKNHYDIIISDICMEPENGIELVKKIKIINPNIAVIFLTGNSEFDVIYNASQIKGMRYILKIDCYTKLIDEVENISLEIKENLQADNLIKQAKTFIEDFKPILKKEYVMQLLSNNSKELFEDNVLDIDINQPICMALFYLNNAPSTLSNLALIKIAIENQLSNNYNIDSAILFNDCVIVLYQIKENDKYAPMFIKDIECVLEYLELSSNIMAFCLYGEKPAQKQNLPSLFNKLNSIKNEFSMKKNSRILSDEKYLAVLKDMNNLSKIKDSYLQSYICELKQLRTLIEVFNEDETGFFIEKFSDIYKKCISYCENNECIFDMFYKELELFFKELAIRIRIYSDLDTNAIKNLEGKLSLNDCVKILNSYFVIKKSQDEKENGSMIDFIKKYIRENVSNEISVSMISDASYYNYNYLSRLFKEETGGNLLKYINNEKIRYAQELLQANDYKIYEIANKIGYSTPAYFIKFFKKHTQMTPSQYREKVRP